MKPLEYHCTVRFNRMITPTVFELGFEPSQPLEFKAGQFVSVIVPGAGPGGRDLRRAYSIASAPEKDPIELCVKRVEGGPGTNYLHQLKVGDRFRGFAPYGDFVYKTQAARRACFVSTGTGIAPFRSMMLSRSFIKTPPVRTTCLLGVRTEDELLYVKELQGLHGAHWVSAVSQPTRSGHGDWFKGRVTDYLRSQGEDFGWKETDFYLCGNGGMITEMKTLLAEKGVEKPAIHQEKYY